MLAASTYAFSFSVGLQLFLHTESTALLYALFSTARSFSSEALFHDYVAPSHIKHATALLPLWALKKLHEAASHPPVQIHTSVIFSLFPIHGSHVEILSSALLPRLYIMDLSELHSQNLLWGG